VVGVFSTGTVKVGGGECLCMKRGSENSFAFTICTLMDYSIVDVEVSDIFGNTWPMICPDKRERVMAGVARVI